MYSFNLLPFIYFHEKHNVKLNVLIPNHKLLSNRNKYGVINKSLLEIIKRSFDKNNIKYFENPMLLLPYLDNKEVLSAHSWRHRIK